MRQCLESYDGKSVKGSKYLRPNNAQSTEIAFHSLLSTYKYKHTHTHHAHTHVIGFNDENVGESDLTFQGK